MFGIYLTPDWPCLDNYRWKKSKSPIFEFLKKINFDSQLHMKLSCRCASVMQIMIDNGVHNHDWLVAASGNSIIFFSSWKTKKKSAIHENRNWTKYETLFNFFFKLPTYLDIIGCSITIGIVRRLIGCVWSILDGTDK